MSRAKKNEQGKDKSLEMSSLRINLSFLNCGFANSRSNANWVGDSQNPVCMPDQAKGTEYKGENVSFDQT